MYPLRLTSLKSIYIVLSFIFIFSSVSHNVAAGSTTSGDERCVDLLLIFARGSGQNKLQTTPNNVYTDNFKDAEKESYAFFSSFKEHIDVEYPNVNYKAVSIHNFEGKYDPVGYKAVPVGLPNRIANTANADVSWIPGDYRDSVEHGVAETVGYLKDQIGSCPDQSIVVGGYSQGAQVMGDSLFQLTSIERQKIVGVGFFGDPKYIGSSGDNLLNPLDKPTSYPWRRGTASNNDKGMLDARIPYLPADIERRAVSYCAASDVVCSGYSGFYKMEGSDGHGHYNENPISQTVNEIMQWAAPQLAVAERKNGGFGSAPTDPYQPTPSQLAKTRDIMFLLNDDSGDTVLQTFRYYLDEVVDPITKQYTGTQYGAKAFGEGQTGTVNLPRINNIQSLQPYIGYDSTKPSTSLSNLARSINARYTFGQVQMGGGDFADPHGLAVERTVFGSAWREDAEKHVVLFTDRSPKDTYSYNICHATVRSWLQIPQTDGNQACYNNIGSDIWPKSQHSEVCETAYIAITSDTCKNAIKTPGYYQYNERTLEDAVRVAQSQNVHVSIVVPYKITDQYNTNDIPGMIKNLKYLAGATGGKFIYYDQRTQYSGVLLSDTLRQIFTHEPKTLVATKKEVAKNDEILNKGIVNVDVGSPVILDVSQSDEHYYQYKWDFNNDGIWDETTDGPVTEVIYSQPYQNYTKVLGINSDGTTAQTNIVVNATTSNTTIVPSILPVVPDINATTNSNGSITLTWSSDELGALLIIDPVSRLPIATGDLNTQSLTFNLGQSYTELIAYVVTDSAISLPSTIQVSPYVSPVIDTPNPTDEPGDPVHEPDLPPVIDETDDPELPIETPGDNGSVLGSAFNEELDPTVCFKLQTCNNESSRELILGLQQSGNSNQFQPIVAAATSTITPQISLVNTTQSMPIETTDSEVKGVATVATNVNPIQSAAIMHQEKQAKFWYKLATLLLIITAILLFIARATRRYQRG